MQLKAYIVRIWRDEDGQFRGHVSNPLTEDRVTFRSWSELRQILAGGLDLPDEDVPGTQSEEVIDHD
jgi:hypothetical protein